MVKSNQNTNFVKNRIPAAARGNAYFEKSIHIIETATIIRPDDLHMHEFNSQVYYDLLPKRRLPAEVSRGLQKELQLQHYSLSVIFL
jgi:hypothetical protein